MNKKIFAAATAAVVLAAYAWSDEAEFSFTNKVYSDIVSISVPYDDDASAEFAGISEKAAVEFQSEKVDAGLDLRFHFGLSSEPDPHGKDYAWLGSDDFGGISLGDYNDAVKFELADYYIEFRPVQILTLGFHDSVFTPGSYLPVEDDNLGNGNIGSDFVLVLRPIEGLRAAAGIDFISYFGSEDYDAALLNFGIDYTNDIFSAGAAFRNVINDFGFGLFAGLTAIDGLTVNAGFSYNDEFADVAGNLLSFGAAYDITDSLSAALDFVTNFGSRPEDSDWADLYLGANVAFGVTEALELSLTGTFKTNYDDAESFAIGAEPDVTVSFGNHEFGFGVSLEFTADDAAIAFPVYWQYSF